MNKEEAKKILLAYRETDDDTGEEYGYMISDYVGEDGDGHVFRCKIEGVDHNALNVELPLMAVYADGTVLAVPMN